jgi:RNA polymerase sigma-70 factor (ECF subfamily)
MRVLTTTSGDPRLMERARRFDQEALAAIFDTYQAGIYRYAMRLLGDPELAQECMAETFSRFLQALQRGGGPQQYLQAYLYRIAHNWITDHYRSKKPPSLPFDGELTDGILPCADLAQDPPEQVEAELETRQVRAALALLTPEQRQVITLKYLEDWDNESIAQALGKPVGAVKALQHRALNALRRLLG